MKLNNLMGVFAAVALTASSSFALSYDASVDRLIAPEGVTFTGYTGAAKSSLGLKKSADGLYSLGVRGGSAGNEIDVGQSLVIAFAKPMHVTSLTLGLLFDGLEYYDYKETAVAQIIGTGTQYKLQAVGETTASWNGFGSVSNVAPAKVNRGGAWTIWNPFGDIAISGFVLFPTIPEDAPRGRTKVDFGLNAFSAVEWMRVPDAASSLALFGAALTGLALWQRRRS